MPPTREQRDKHPLCDARKKDGNTCRLFAGQGTDHPGFGACKHHGGSTPNGKKYALALEAKQRMVAMSVPVANAEPHLVLLDELAASAGHVGFLRQEIAGLERREIGSDRSRVLLHRYDTERDRLTRIAKACSEAGVDEARIQIEQARAVRMVSLIVDAAKDAGVPPRYIKALGPALRKQIALMSGDLEAAEALDAKVAEVREKIAAQEERRIERAAANRRPADLSYPPEEWVAEPPSAS